MSEWDDDDADDQSGHQVVGRGDEVDYISDDDNVNEYENS